MSLGGEGKLPGRVRRAERACEIIFGRKSASPFCLDLSTFMQRSSSKQFFDLNSVWQVTFQTGPFIDGFVHNNPL